MDKQKITANGVDIFVDTVISKKDIVQNAFHEILELRVTEPLTAEQVTALQTDPAWVLFDYDGTEFPKDAFNNLLEIRYLLGQVDPNAAIIREKDAQIAQAQATAVAAQEELATTTAKLTQKEEEVAGLEQEVTTVATTLLRGATRERALPLKQYIPEWAPGPFQEGDIRQEAGRVYQLVEGKAHDATGNPSWNPASQPSLWFLWHGFSKETALPFVPVTGAHDMYKDGEWMIFPADASARTQYYYEALEDTAYSPKDYARAWRKDTAV